MSPLAVFKDVKLRDLRRITLDVMGVAGFLAGLHCLVFGHRLDPQALAVVGIVATPTFWVAMLRA